MKSDRFELEERIMRCWQTSDDLEDFVTEYYEGETPMTQDEVFNALWGLREIHNIRMQRLMDAFARTFQLDKYAPDEVKELREQFFNGIKYEGECND